MTDSRRWYLHPLWISLGLLLVIGATIAATVGSYAGRRMAAFAWVERTGGYVQFESPPGWLPEALAGYWPQWLSSVEDVRIDTEGHLPLEQLRAFREAQS